MTTVFMKFLERRPSEYDRGIHLLTAGRMEGLRQRVAEEWVEPGARVLDIGCGTGAQALICAQRGATVTGVDTSQSMLEEAEARAILEGVSERVEFRWLDASEIGEHFAPRSFDLIILSLVLSELGERSQTQVLAACGELLSHGGRLIIVEEVVPEGRLAGWAYGIQRLFWATVTLLLTGTTTYPLRQPELLLARAGFRAVPLFTSGAGLRILLGQKRVEGESALREASDVPELRHRVTLGTVARDLACLITRIWPPYLRMRPGLYRIGRPGSDSPVLVTGNFDLTVRRVVRGVQGHDCYLLVADSRGINVWCAAGGGHLNADKVITSVKRSGLGDLVRHRRLILPQLCANGVEGRRVEEATGWHVLWGPTRADDIPAYLARGRRKTDSMRLVAFPLMDRLEMSAVMWLFMAPLLALLMLILDRRSIIPALLSLLVLFVVTASLWPRIPGYQGTTKGLFLAATCVALTLLLSVTVQPLPPRRVFNWAVGLTALSLFVAADFQGADPRRRGGEVEQLPKIAPLELALGAAYLLVPRLAGW
jgi:ubiquinone/menaquinone biosynthesis C-methylase UbiE